MTRQVLLVANRGDVAVRVVRAAKALGMETVAVFSEDDARAMHARVADRAVPLQGIGARAYLSVADIVAAATVAGATLLHPGWGFLSEQAELARGCADAGVTFVGPEARTLEVLGNKVETRELAHRADVPVVESTGPTSLEGAAALLSRADPGHGIMLKAVAGGGGRGIRVVTSSAQLESAYRDCSAEAANAFDDGRLFAELFIPHSRHVEVQVIADGRGQVVVVGDRDCSIQRNWQKLIEIAPAPNLPAPTRTALWAAAESLATAAGLTGVATFEFLVDADDPTAWWFMEANPRLQVEHTVTEQVTGIDIVQAQLRIAQGETLDDLGLAGGRPQATGIAIQARVNAESMTSHGVVPSSGRIAAFDVPRGARVRVDTGYESGDVLSSRYDSLLAKVITHEPSDSLAAAVVRAREAVQSISVTGVETNRSLLLAALDDPRLAAGELSTSYLERLLVDMAVPELQRHITGTDGVAQVHAETAGIVTHIDAVEGDVVRAGGDLVRIEVMKMQHVAVAPIASRVTRIPVAVGDEITVGQVLAELVAVAVDEKVERESQVRLTPEAMAEALTALAERRVLAQDAGRKVAVAATHARGRLTVREKIATLVNPETFVEIGELAIAARLWRDSADELARKTPGDGVVTGTGTIAHDAPHADPWPCAVIAYDPSVLAGTQGVLGSQKVERLIDLATRMRLPIALMADGGGGRPGDEAPGTSSNPLRIFHQLGKLSGQVPIVGTVSGACFAGNAAMLGCSDVIVATRDANIGMGGPVVINAAKLGQFEVSEIGPALQLHEAGVVDVLVDDDHQATVEVRRTLGYFSGDDLEWGAPDQSLLSSILPEDRLRAYDVRDLIHQLADTDSVQELKAAFGASMVVAFSRVEGMPVGFIANNPRVKAGAIDGPGAEKGAWFARLCNRFAVPVVFLCDTPGFAVGPEAEATGQLKDLSSFLVAGAQLEVPHVTVITRKAYGVGAVAMCGGSFRAPLSVVAWPTAEIGSMAPEAAVRLASGRELSEIVDEQDREAEYQKQVRALQEKVAPLGAAARFRIDDVIDPADTRELIAGTVRMWRGRRTGS